MISPKIFLTPLFSVSFDSRDISITTIVIIPQVFEVLFIYFFQSVFLFVV